MIFVKTVSSSHSMSPARHMDCFMPESGQTNSHFTASRLISNWKDMDSDTERFIRYVVLPWNMVWFFPSLALSTVFSIAGLSGCDEMIMIFQIPYVYETQLHDTRLICSLLHPPLLFSCQNPAGKTIHQNECKIIGFSSIREPSHASQSMLSGIN